MNKKSLRYKMVILGMAIVIIPLIVVISFLLYQISGSYKNLSKKAQAETAKSLSAMVQLVLTEELKVASVLSNDSTLVAYVEEKNAGRLNKAEIKNFERFNHLTEMVDDVNNKYDVIFLADAKGNIFADTQEGKAL